MSVSAWRGDGGYFQIRGALGECCLTISRRSDASTDSVCVQTLAEQSSLGAQDVLKAPAYAYAVKTSSTSYSVHW